MPDPALAALNSLLRNTSIDDDAEALQLATAAIKSAKPGSADLITAQHARVVALLKLDRFEDALRALGEGDKPLEEICVMEKAYALYKTGDLEGADAVLRESNVSSENRGVKHVAAQIAYRAERTEDAAEIYRELLGNQEGANFGEENDLRINLLASIAQLEWQGKGWAVPEQEKKTGREELEAFETAYNAACGSISRGDFAKAAVLLKRARDLCEASEDLSEEERKAELVPIMVQQAYVFIKLGKTEEAANLHKSIELSEVSDKSTKAILRSNQVILQAEKNPFLAARMSQSIPQIIGNDRFFEYQASAFQRNEYTLDLKSQKFPGVERRTFDLLSEASLPTISSSKCDLGVFAAAALSELKTGKEALQSILPYLEKRPKDLGLLLTVIQLYIQLQNPAVALQLLESFFEKLEKDKSADRSDVRFAPGLVALAVSLYRSQNQRTALRKELAKAAAHWQKQASPSAAGNGNRLIREAGIELLRSSNPEDLAAAGEAFNYLVTAQPGDRTAKAGLIASFATSDFEKVKPYLDILPPVEKLTAGVDVESLLSAGVATLANKETAEQPSKKRSLEEATADEKEKKQAPPQQPASKKRRRKLPKDFDPEKKPDPERWLPLRNRSSYRPKGKKGKKRAMESTQGGPVKGEDQEMLELAGGAGSVKVEKAGGGGGGGGAGNKKKRKGKK
ncbi:hypothetical protein QBC37DRAFT_382607 [Rhypophila decipiens]|uniref:Signal recognition particle subunit SRP72 n=1 Tax=Rhypophila decipiens TaxID=261697 RepID=A0AAN7BB62_9PEZI|nr:hypothetical protein QBC37DRAFT_382607 [Rhypophila decipiens]